ncbi:hypothetical protein LO763_01430 [Glycomyces sp. A-F 0318]|uniref:hypothetical protein n=1 Tax=Glycomyces amatae TaxID=2881355 RepID=UPI001E4E69D4|nr:hypothetical protein [Glycomyces amatae]MCD0442286.1 hypothetical protein [Glycomyces amatae]
MTYPPPGGENPQYQLQPEPQQPSDPYTQGYNSTPPPGNYYQQQPPQYSQPPGPQMMPPQIGVQQGYPSAPGSVLPPPIPPASSGNNLGIILGVIVAIVVVLGVAAVLIIPGLTEDEEPQAGGDDPATSEEASEEATSEEPAPETTEEAAPTEDTGGGALEGWGTPINSEDAYDTSTPEGAAISYQVAQDNGDDAAMQALVSSNATDDMLWDLDWEMNDTTDPYGFLYWGVSREADGEVQAWSGWTFDDLAPDSEDDLSTGYTYTLVEEDGQWKLYDLVYGAP